MIYLQKLSYYRRKFCSRRLGRFAHVRRNESKIVVFICCCFLLFVIKNCFEDKREKLDTDSVIESLKLLDRYFNGTFADRNGLWNKYVADDRTKAIAEEKYSEIKKYIQKDENYYESLLGYKNGSGNGCYLKNGTRVFENCCPLLPYQWNTCHILFVAEPYEKKRKRRSGYFLINNQYLPTDLSEDGIHFILLSKNCEIKFISFFTDIKEAEIVINLLPQNTIVVGVSVGVFGRLLTEQLGYNLLFKVKSSLIAFSTVKGLQADADFQAVSKHGGREEIYIASHYGVRWNLSSDDALLNTQKKRDLNAVQGNVLWYPSHCNPRWKVAIVIPYRNRETHLNIFLQNMVPFLRKQMVSYTIIVVEQAGSTAFNRASLMNIGFLVGQKLDNFDCYIFHDVDLIPEDLTNLYACAAMPRHLAVGRNKDNYRLKYPEYVGGAIMLRPEHILKFNGFSNKFFGWGGEDDNIYMRVKAAGLNVTRFPKEVARYIMLIHGEEPENPHMNRSFPLRWTHQRSRISSDVPKTNIDKLLNYTEKSGHSSHEIWSSAYQPASDGLHLAKYKLLSMVTKPLYVWAKVDIPGPNYKELICKDQSKVAYSSPAIRKRLDELCRKSSKLFKFDKH